MPTIPILFGTETGNAEYSAKELKSALTSDGYAATVVDMGQFSPEALASAPLVLIVTSTYGKGDPPVNAEKLLKHLRDDRPNLGQLRYGVCALGDSTYQDFAQCGRDFDRLLAECGAQRVIELCVCDADFEEFFPTFKTNAVAYVATTGGEFRGAAEETAPKKGFFQKVFGIFGGGGASSSPPPQAARPAAAAPADEHAPSRAKLLSRRRLNKGGSAKQTMHYELALAGSGISYEPGDCIAVHAQNSASDVSAFLAALGLEGSARVQTGTGELSLEKALLDRDFHRIPSSLAELLARGSGPLSAPGANAKDYRHRRHLLEAVSEHTGVPAIAPQVLLDMLLPAPPRLYSVASSQKATPGEVHLTVETPRYTQDGFARVGFASGYLSDRVADGDTITVHKVLGTHFRVAPPEADMIMVGPGTGVAPFRGFLWERSKSGATGKNWLFFGHQHAASDFLYQEEFEAFQSSGLLTRLDCAWSRDQAEKRYVQHLMSENGAEIWRWLEGGAILYVCGDKLHMAADVHKALVSIVAEHGGKDAAAAASFIDELEKSGRYRLDVY